MTRARDVATQGGLVLLGTNTFTTASSVQFDNVFTSTYDNYRAVVSLSAKSATGGVWFRFVDGTTPVTTQDYVWSWNGYTIANAFTNNYSGTAGLTYGDLAEASSGAGNRYGSVADIYSPNLARPTTYTFNTSGTGTGNSYAVIGGGAFYPSTVFEGIQFIPNSGTFSGTISIYGYKKN